MTRLSASSPQPDAVSADDEVAWASFRAAARSLDGAGRRRVVPVIGSGVNVAAGLRDSWWRLLARVAAGHEGALPDGLLERPGVSATAVWEALLLALARPGETAASVERRLQVVVAKHLRAGHEARAPELDLHRRLVSLRFTDVASINFDRNLLLAQPAYVDVAGDDSLSRHGMTAGTRVWYPHGDARRAETIRLGVRRYGVYIQELERTYRGIKAAERRRSARGRGARRPPATWIEAMLDQPIVFLGCGLSSDEWPLWWFLHQRARNHGRRSAGRRPGTYVMMAGPRAAIPPDLRVRRAGVQVLRAPDHAEAWERFFDAFVPAGVCPSGVTPSGP